MNLKKAFFAAAAVATLAVSSIGLLRTDDGDEGPRCWCAAMYPTKTSLRMR